MKYEINGKIYDVVIERKNNKNIYVRVKEDLKIYVSANYLTSDRRIIKTLDDSHKFLINSITRQEELNHKKKDFYFLGKKYNVIFLDTKVEIIDDNIYVKDLDSLNKWLKKETERVFKSRLDYDYNLYKEKIPYPKLRIRKMKTRWGVCNVKTNTVTLNSELIKYSVDKLDYVIFHELSHFLHFNHSKSFWNQVSKYVDDYKKIRKELKS